TPPEPTTARRSSWPSRSRYATTLPLPSARGRATVPPPACAAPPSGCAPAAAGIHSLDGHESVIGPLGPMRTAAVVRSAVGPVPPGRRGDGGVGGSGEAEAVGTEIDDRRVDEREALLRCVCSSGRQRHRRSRRLVAQDRVVREARGRGGDLGRNLREVPALDG